VRRHKSLAPIYVRHFAFETSKAIFDRVEHIVAERHLAAEELRDRVARLIVFRGAKPAARNYELGAFERARKRIANIFSPIADDCFANYFDADFVQLGCKKKGIGVNAVWSEKFGADSNDFSLHQLNSRAGSFRFDCAARGTRAASLRESTSR
jgi:hypothetical protein